MVTLATFNKLTYQHKGTNPLRILLIEDDMDDIYLIQKFLKSLNPSKYSLASVNCLSDGLSKLKEKKFDLIILDLSLPDSQGIDTFYKLLPIASNVPIIIVSGLCNESIALQAISSGAQDCLIKGEFDECILWKTIEHSIHRLNNSFTSENKSIVSEKNRECNLTSKLGSYYESHHGEKTILKCKSNDFDDLVSKFELIINKNIASYSVSPEYYVSDDLILLAKELYALNANGVDVLQIYTLAMDKKRSISRQAISKNYSSIARCLAMELMTHLINEYKSKLKKVGGCDY